MAWAESIVGAEVMLGRRHRTIKYFTVSSLQRNVDLGKSRSDRCFGCWIDYSVEKWSDGHLLVATDYGWNGYIQPRRAVSSVHSFKWRGSNQTKLLWELVWPQERLSLQQARRLCNSGTWIQSKVSRAARKRFRWKLPSSRKQERRYSFRKLLRVVGDNHHGIRKSHDSPSLEKSTSAVYNVSTTTLQPGRRSLRMKNPIYATGGPILFQKSCVTFHRCYQSGIAANRDAKTWSRTTSTTGWCNCINTSWRKRTQRSKCTLLDQNIVLNSFPLPLPERQTETIPHEGILMHV